MTDFYVNRQKKYSVAKITGARGIKLGNERKGEVKNINTQIMEQNVSLCLCKKTRLISVLTETSCKK